MTTVLEQPRGRTDSPAQAPRSALIRRLPVPVVAAAAVVVLRLPFYWLPIASDEGGYLTVARQWHPGGSSLYGYYWVDRPPLLIGIYQLAASLGGLPALRTLGCLAATVTVLAVGWAASQLGGRRAAGWASVAAAALLASPLMGAAEIDGELLAAPFVAMGIALSIAAIQTVRDDDRRLQAYEAAGGAGACGVAALLVKQNMADVAVFAIAALLVAALGRSLPARRCGAVAGAMVAGGCAALALVAAFTLARGTSLIGVYDAMYPFRIEAAGVIAAANSSSDATRFHLLLVGWCAGITPIAIAGFVAAIARRRLGGPVVWGLVAVLTYACASIAFGGNYWAHYLIELIVPVSIAIGLLATVWHRSARLVTASIATVALVAWGAVLWAPSSETATAVGEAIKNASAPGDTIVTAYGDPDIVETTGLSSPYPYLWSLPAHTLDPTMTRLAAVLGGAGGPTWFVPRSSESLDAYADIGLQAIVDENYRPVATLCGRTVYLHRGLTRPTPTALTCTRSPMADVF